MGEPERAAAAMVASLSSDASVRADPYPLYARLREQQPVLRVPNGVVLSRWHDGKAALADPRLGAGFILAEDSPFVRARGGLDAPAVRAQGRNMLFNDPPAHTRLRRLVGNAFARSSLDRLRPQIQSVVDGLLDRVATRGSMDAIADFALPVPVAVICLLVGIPLERATRFRHLADDIVRFLDVHLTPESIERMNTAHEQMTAILRDIVEQRRAEPGDDLISALLSAEEEGDRLTHEEVIAMIDLLFGAGHETTVNLIGNGLYTLLRHPAQLAEIRQDPALLPGAIEEILRFESPTQTALRRALVDIDVAGVPVPAGQQMVVLIGAAQRDPARFTDPDRFDIHRTDGELLSFGGGVHYCIGSMLARLEAVIALGAVIQRFPRLRLTHEPDWRPHGTLRGLERLPVRL